MILTSEEERKNKSYEKDIDFDPQSSSFYEIQNLEEAEALITSYPSSSKAWICYIVYVLKQGETAKARSLARRGMQAMNFRDEQERLNLWLALLNMELHYGSNNSFNSVLQEALQYNDQEKIYNHIMDLYVSTNKTDEVDKLQQTMLKKFKYNKNVWIKFGTFYYQSSNLKEGRNILNRSLQSLPAKEHSDVLGKFAHLEYKHGDVQRSLSMYEDILTKFPKRKDLKSTYIHILKELGHERAEILAM